MADERWQLFLSDGSEENNEAMAHAIYEAVQGNKEKDHPEDSS